MDEAFAAGRSFIQRQARLLEQRIFSTCFDGAPGSGVVDALRGYQNQDGGFGHGLEPDKRCPASLPIDVEVALQAMVAAKVSDPSMLNRAGDFLGAAAEAAGAGGAVPLALPVIEAYPRAQHWSDWTYQPGLNPTAGLVGLLLRLGVEHPWVEQGAAYCWRRLDAGQLPEDGHTLSEVLVFLENARERERADLAAEAVAGRLPTASFFNPDPDFTEYGLTPLHLAPQGSSRWRRLFAEDNLQGHLDRLARDQQADGGWPISWEPPSDAARLEWRGIETLRALRTLSSYGRLAPAP